MEIRESYNLWAEQYDSDDNKTRDLEAVSLRKALAGTKFKRALEIGCGTGKNTVFLSTMVDELAALDFSEKMLLKAKEKISSGNVRFVLADINGSWNFAGSRYDLVTFSLVLEHIEDLGKIFENLNEVTEPDALVYIGELHPFRQYQGAAARFISETGQNQVRCFIHHVSEFVQAAKQHHFQIEDLREYFDNKEPGTRPRILSLKFRKRRI